MLKPLLQPFMALVCSVVLGSGIALGQDYPNRPVRMLTSPPGGGADFLARLIAQGISGSLGQQVIVDNRAPNVLGESLAKAPPDGYTLLLLGRLLWVQPLIQETAYDPIADFASSSTIGNTPSVLVVHPSLPVKSVKELIALAKSKPGVLNYSVGAIGTSGHLAAEFFKSMADVNMVGIPYNGAGPQVIAVLSGEADLTFSTLASVAPHIKTGRLNALAICTTEPSALAPGLPTVAAAGLPGFEAGDLTVVFAPAKTPDAIINRLNQEIVRLLSRADVKMKFLTSGVEPVSSSPEAIAAKIKFEMVQMRKIIRDAGIKSKQ